MAREGRPRFSTVLAGVFAAGLIAASPAAAASPQSAWSRAVAKTLGAPLLHAANSYCDHNFCRLERFDIDRSGGRYWDLQRTWVQQGFGAAALYSIVNTVDSKRQRTDTNDDPMCLMGRLTAADRADRAIEQLRALLGPATKWRKGKSKGGFVARGPKGWQASFGLAPGGSFRAVSVIPRKGQPVQRLSFTLPAKSAKPLAATYGCVS